MVITRKKFLESRQEDLEIVENTLRDMVDLDISKKQRDALWGIVSLICEVRGDEIED